VASEPLGVVGWDVSVDLFVKCFKNVIQSEGTSAIVDALNLR